MGKLVFVIFVMLLIILGTTAAYHLTQKADIYYFTAKEHFVKGAFKEAIPFYEDSIKLDPTRFESLRELAYCYHWTNDNKKAIDIFVKALSLDPGENKLKRSLAEAYSWSGNYKEAVRLYRSVIDETNDIDAKRSLAEVYIWGRQYEEAKGLLKAILEEYPQDKKAKLLFAKALHFSGDGKEAIRLYKEILQ